MHILIAATVDLLPEAREKALLEAQPFIRATQEEHGCIEYTWTPSVTVPGRIHVFEEWEDEESLRGHFESGPYAAMRAHLRKAGVTGAANRKYRVDAISPVYDSEGRSRPDFSETTGDWSAKRS